MNPQTFLRNPTCNKINNAIEPFWMTLYKDREMYDWHHSVQHILAFDWESCPSPEAAIAAVYHDADYDPQKGDQETVSANIAMKICEKYFPDVNISQVVRLIMSTKDHINSYCKDDVDMVWLHYNDLSYLRELDISNIIATEKRIFREYQYVPFHVYREKRIEILNQYRKHLLVYSSTISEIIEFLNSWVPNIGIYPGSFNPFHVGHKYILDEASKIFDKVIVAQGQNLEKSPSTYSIFTVDGLRDYQKETFTNLFELLDNQKKECNLTVIRGIRNGGDLSDELTLQTFIREKTKLPCINIFTDPNRAHISSGAIRQLETLKVIHDLVLK
jgi:cytidyltransferase-like protein